MKLYARVIPTTAFTDSVRLDDWFNGLAELMNNEGQRNIQVTKGCKLIDREFSLPTVTAQWRKTPEFVHGKS